MLRKSFTFKLEEAADDGTIEGYGSTFGGMPDSYGDIVVAGAFAESLTRHKAEGSMPLMLWGHNAGDLPIGQWTEMGEDAVGLRVKGVIDMVDPQGARVHRNLKRGTVRGLSIGYEVIERRDDETRHGVRLLEKLELHEVSVVNFPANRRSLVDGVKAAEDARVRLAAGDRLTEREWDALFKDMGLTNSEAERAVRANLKGRGEPDAPETGDDFIAALAVAMGATPTE